MAKISRSGVKKAGISLGAFAVGAIAGAIAGVLLAPKSGRETRADIRRTLAKIQTDVAKRVGALKNITQEKYHEIVSNVVGTYERQKKITGKQAKAIKADLKKGFTHLRSISKHAARG
jgi:gas vesicle protein